MPSSPSQQEAVITCPSLSISVATTEPTIAGMPNSLATIAAWQVRPPLFVIIADAFFITGSQSGSVISVTSTSPAWNSWPSVIRLSNENKTATLPVPILSPTAMPLNKVLRGTSSAITYSVILLKSFLEWIVSGLACTINNSLLNPSTAHSTSIGHQWPFSLV